MTETYRDALETYIAANANPTNKFGHQPRLGTLHCLSQQEPA
jgi:uncharacterized protein